MLDGLGRLEKGLGTMHTEIGVIKNTLHTVDCRVSNLEQTVRSMDGRMHASEARLDSHEHDFLLYARPCLDLARKGRIFDRDFDTPSFYQPTRPPKEDYTMSLARAFDGLSIIDGGAGSYNFGNVPRLAN